MGAVGIKVSLEAEPGVIFSETQGATSSPHLIIEWFKRHRDAAGIPTGTAQTLRHTMAKTALTDGVPLHMVAARLGDPPRATLGVYRHLLPNSDSAAAESLARILVDSALTSRAAGTLVQRDRADATAGTES